MLIVVERIMSCRSRFLWLLSFLAILLLSCQTVMASEYDGEYTYPAGTSWGFQEPATYKLSDTSLAELVPQTDGNLWVKLNRPGDLIVTVRFPHNDFTGTYLIHITGQAVDETAIDQMTFAQEVLALVNEERAKEGAPPLRLAEDMLQAADIRAKELTTKFSHTRPDGSSCFTVLRNQGNGVGENIAAGQTSPEAVMECWMNSPGHRKNILDPHYKELGVGYTYQKNTEYQHYWVQLFRR